MTSLMRPANRHPQVWPSCWTGSTSRLTPKLSAARHGCRAAKALYLSGMAHQCSPKLPPRVRCSLLLGDPPANVEFRPL